MKSATSSGRPKKLKLLLVRRVVGESMTPCLKPGQLVIATSLFSRIQAGEVYIFRHQGLEKIKRLKIKDNDKLFFIGDNLSQSKDSRHFGLVDRQALLAKVIWPRITS